MISLLLGLGNIGSEYEDTRHNAGFMVIERLLGNQAAKLNRSENDYDWAEKQIGGSTIVLAMPKTYMNLSGLAALALLQGNNFDPSQMLVLVDDFNLPLGSIRIRRSGSDGGHNGLASLCEVLETDQFPRLRLGIGPIPEAIDTTRFVLGAFDSEEKKPVEIMIKKASEAVVYTIEHGLDEAMKKYN